MTPRKELFIEVKKALKSMPELELVDLQRNQMNNSQLANFFVFALISINATEWKCRTEQNLEGEATLLIDLYCRDGWQKHQQSSQYLGEELMEIDLIERMAETLQFLSGKLFQSLTLKSDEVITNSINGMFQYRLSFSCKLYHKLKPFYKNRKITI